MDKFSSYVLFVSTYLILFVEQRHVVLGNVSRIVGGTQAQAHFGRFHASLQNMTGHHVCGGAVVSKWHVVTAAHCVVGANPKFIKVVVGTTHLDRGGKVYDVKAIHINDKYNMTTRNNDIAVITIKGAFNTSHASCIKLSEKGVTEGDPVTIAGFGAIEPNGESSREMLALNLQVFCQKTCEYAMRKSREVTENMFCTFSKIGQGTCHGDSGSPVTKYDELVGIVSWGIPCAVGFPDVHTRVTPYVSWIKKIIKDRYCELKLGYKDTLLKVKSVK